MTPFARRRRWTVLAVAAIAAATWFGLRWSGELPRRFAEVEPGKLYHRKALEEVRAQIKKKKG